MRDTTPDNLKRVILFWVSNDYEQVGTILKNVSDDINETVPTDELWKILVELKSIELVDSFVYDRGSKDFVAVSHPEESKADDIWWLISKKGKELLLDE